jgi:hypothetical protein
MVRVREGDRRFKDVAWLREKGQMPVVAQFNSMPASRSPALTASNRPRPLIHLVIVLLPPVVCVKGTANVLFHETQLTGDGVLPFLIVVSGPPSFPSPLFWLTFQPEASQLNYFIYVTLPQPQVGTSTSPMRNPSEQIDSSSSHPSPIHCSITCQPNKTQEPHEGFRGDYAN